MENKKPLNYALFLLKIRDRSSGEIKDKMVRKGFSSEEVKKAVDTLFEHQFLNDEKFAKSYVRSQIGRKPRGKYQLAAKLKKLHIDNEIIENTFNGLEIDETALAKLSAENWLRKHGSVPQEKIFGKLGRYLVGQGFGWEAVRKILDHNDN